MLPLTSPNSSLVQWCCLRRWATAQVCVLAASLGLGITGSIVGTEAAIAIPPQSSETVATKQHEAVTQTVLGVVLADSSELNEDNLSQRLERLNINYRLLDWEAIQHPDDLQGITTLLLPSVETISPQQLQLLQAWTRQGRPLIVSGQVGTASSQAVQDNLRSLLGAYWAFSLPTANPLRLNSRLLPVDLRVETISIMGGVLVPMGVRSRAVASWQSPPDRSVETARVAGAPAVIVNGSTVFLGWNWGQNTTSQGQDFDTDWLGAVLSYQGTGQVDSPVTSHSSDPAESPSIPTASTLLTEQIHRLSSPQPQDLEAIAPPASATANPAGSHSQPQRSRRQRAEQQAERGAQRQPQASTTSSELPNSSTTGSTANGSDSNGSSTPVARRSPTGSLPTASPPDAPSLPLSPATEDDFVDPTEQIAPPGLTVEESPSPISILESMAMEEELEHLIGRFESALLSAIALDAERSPNAFLVAEAAPTRNESTDRVHGENQSGAGSSADLYNQVMGHPALEEARHILDRFPDLVIQQQYGEARQQWLAARQILWENFPSDRPIAQPEVRSIWLDRGTIVEAGSRRGLAQIFDRLAESGINTVFVETVNAGYPIYPSRVAPQQNPLTRHWDPLQAAVELAHERDMEAHAWVWVFAAGNQRHNAILGLPASYPGPVLAAHPDWANADRQGRAIPVGQNKPFLDPANPNVRRYSLDLYREIVTNYDVDGLHLDYIRYPFQNAASGRSYGYGRAARQQFQQQTGVDPLSISPQERDLWAEWTEFRVEQVNSFVAEVADEMQRIRPEVVLSAAVFAMAEHERIHKLQQHWETWAQAGDVDMIVTMSYALDTNRFRRLTAPWLLDDDVDLGSTIIVPGIQLLNLPDDAAFDQIQLLRDTPAGGYALFAAEHFSDDLSHLFTRTQNQPQASTPVPFRDPFATAAARFEALRRECNFLINSGDMWIREAEREAWAAESEALQQQLQQLAANPSHENIRAARQAFDEFRDRFSDWMYLHSLSHDYRVQIWGYRLDVIDNLLTYGDDRQPNRRAGR